MRDKNRVDKIVVEKIIGYCDDIEENMNQINATYEIYLTNKMFRYACDMCVLQIGELIKRLSEDFKGRHSEIPWHSIKAMRNVLVHEYEVVNLESAWKDLTRDVPELKSRLELILLEEAANENHDA